MGAPSARVPSLRQKFTRAVIVAALFPAAILGVVEQVSAFRSQQKLLRERVEVAAVLSANAVQDFLRAHLAGVRLSARLSSQVTDWSGQLVELRESYPALLSALAADADGNVLATHPAPPTGTPSFGVRDRPYFSVPRATGNEFVSNAFVGRRLGSDHLVAVSAPIVEQGRFIGLVEGSIRVDAFTSLRNSLVRRRGLEVLIVDRERRTINASAGLPYQFMQQVEPDLFTGDIRNDQGASPARTTRLGGKTFWVSHAQLECGWTLFIFASEDEIWAAARQRLGATAGVLLLVSLGVWLAYTWQMRRFDAVLKRLIVALNNLAAGGSPRVGNAEVLPAEFQLLGQAIGTLSSELYVASEGLERALNEQRLLSGELQHSLEQREQEVAARTAELRTANAELDRLTRIDPLTGCLNRRGLESTMATMSDETGCLNSPIYVIAIDIDSFKAYNDGYGHAAGDAAIRRVAQILRRAVADEDAYVTRMGGEEFLVVGMDLNDEGRQDSLAERIREAVAALGIEHRGSPWGHVTVSLGCARGVAGSDYATAVLAADEALYRAKQMGRNRVEK